MLLLLLSGSTIYSCTYTKGELAVDCTLPASVSFSRDIVPIFTAHCTNSGCHNSSDWAGNLNLEAASAYSGLMQAGKGYIDTLNPQYGVLYNKLTVSSSPMPPSGKLDACKVKLILKWMQQDAKNN